MKNRATVICSRADAILLVTRGNGRWSLPGGTVKRGESAHEAALRELAEETGLLFPRVEFLFVFGGFQKRHYVFHCALPFAAVPRASREIAGCAWHRATQPLPHDASVPTREIVRLFAARIQANGGIDAGAKAAADADPSRAVSGAGAPASLD